MREIETLTENEKILMNLFWEQDKPLTSVELVQMCKEREWTQEHILFMIKNIRKKGLLKEVGITRMHTKRAHQFIPTKTKEEYAAQITLAAGIGMDSFSKTALAIAKNLGTKNEIIEKLEEMIRELKEQQDD